jgi:hypothetical protein
LYLSGFTRVDFGAKFSITGRIDRNLIWRISMRILTRAAGTVFIAAALATAMAPAAGAATTAPAQAQWGDGGDSHGCHTSYFRHHVSHRCWTTWNEYYPDRDGRDHEGFGERDGGGDHHEPFDSNHPTP